VIHRTQPSELNNSHYQCIFIVFLINGMKDICVCVYRAAERAIVGKTLQYNQNTANKPVNVSSVECWCRMTSRLCLVLTSVKCVSSGNFLLYCLIIRCLSLQESRKYVRSTYSGAEYYFLLCVHFYVKYEVIPL